jgi:D-sorbitol dehydrogenase (acceptor)
MTTPTSTEAPALQRLKNRHALLTGAGGGIGAAVAAAYLREGARCSIVDMSGGASDEVAGLSAQYPGQVHYISANVTQSADIARLVLEAAAQFGPIHVLFNNAAIFDMAPLLESDEAMYDKMFAVNVKGAFFVMQKVLAHMVAHQTHGAVINMASQAGRRGEALVSHYCATKAAIISYTQSAALAMAAQTCPWVRRKSAWAKPCPWATWASLPTSRAQPSSWPATRPLTSPPRPSMWMVVM